MEEEIVITPELEEKYKYLRRVGAYSGGRYVETLRTREDFHDSIKETVQDSRDHERRLNQLRANPKVQRLEAESAKLASLLEEIKTLTIEIGVEGGFNVPDDPDSSYFDYFAPQADRISLSVRYYSSWDDRGSNDFDWDGLEWVTSGDGASC